MLQRHPPDNPREETIFYQKMVRFFYLGVLVILFSCAENDAEEDIQGLDAGWAWGDSVTEFLGPFVSDHVAFASRDLGCSLFGGIEVTSNKVRFSCGYRVTEMPQLQAKHYERRKGFIDDGPLENFSFTGIVLIVLTTHLQRNWYGDLSTFFTSDALRVAKTAAKIDRLEEVFFEDISLVFDSPEYPEGRELCWFEVNPGFVLCWDNTRTGHRAYQLIIPEIPELQRNPDALKEFEFAQGLGVYWPLLDQYVLRSTGHHSVNTKVEDLVSFIDEVLPLRHPRRSINMNVFGN